MKTRALTPAQVRSKATKMAKDWAKYMESEGLDIGAVWVRQLSRDLSAMRLTEDIG